ncbi:MAG: hypothetical protein CM1200mP3_06070 [Chloroflexota bacterium]|nr:MAG: hypothetical protein CM1200mP3_06070 [Chloroflexota bacterium]
MAEPMGRWISWLAHRMFSNVIKYLGEKIDIHTGGVEIFFRIMRGKLHKVKAILGTK